MTIKSIRVVSPNDCGCEITRDEHTQYCVLVARRVVELYSGYSVSCMLADTDHTRVYVDGDEHSDEARHIRCVAQDVWEAGDFWTPQATVTATLRFVLDLATATTAHECRVARKALNEATHYWNQGRSYPPFVRKALREAELSVDPNCAMRTEEDNES